MQKKNRRAQVTIFIIIAIVIVSAVLLFIFLRKEVKSIDHPEENTKSFIQSCVKESVENPIYKIMNNGGIINPSQSINYKDEEYSYLCYQSDYYKGCINRYPLLEKIIEENIKKETSKEIEDCFTSLKEDLANKGFEVFSGEKNYSIDLLPGIIKIELKRDVRIFKEEKSQSFNDFTSEVISPLYFFVNIARRIVDEESSTCNFDYTHYMLLYPEYEIKRTDFQNTKLYRIIHRKSGEEFKFAIRSCVIPPGVLVT